MTAPSSLQDRYCEQLLSEDGSGSRPVFDEARQQTDGATQLLAGLARFAGHHEAGEGELPAAVVVDALADLTPAYVETFPEPLLLAADAYARSLRARSIAPACFEEWGESDSSVVPVSALEDALAEGNLERICGVLDRLRRAIGTPEYLLEVLLDAVAPENTPDGRLLVHASAAVKLLHRSSWEEGRGIIERLAAALAAEPVLPAPLLSEMPGPVPCRAGLLASLGRERPERAWLYLAHAFQAARYAQL
ncbi:MAG: hypothetical protein GF346_02860, partial [Candidatus Eisenbacteria bacterium]|nr:hypothetical protein [Candidatus Latescibacterota bacterium]MBD3301361.1 hypothetical protein [Candidatus Eisenbacteria bacterium]